MTIRLLLSILLVIGTSCQNLWDWGKRSKKTELSKVFTVDRVYQSMLGPFKTSELTLADSENQGLIWITGFKSVVVAEDGENQLSQEFMCHSNLRYKSARIRRSFRSSRHVHGRLFTISQGQTEVQFLDGFGIPVMANEMLLLDNQLLNMNLTPENLKEPLKVRYKNVVSFIKEKDSGENMIPLYQVEAGGMVSLDGQNSYYDTLNPSELQQGAMCSPGETATSNIRVLRRDRLGQNFTYHWILKPGRETRHTLITNQINLRFDTTIHYIAVHMNPYAESLVLKDLTE